MPVVDTFPSLLREGLETAFEQDIDHVFDVTQVRRSLYQQKVDLELELRRVRQSLLTINYIGKNGVVYHRNSSLL